MKLSTFNLNKGSLEKVSCSQMNSVGIYVEKKI